MIRYVHTVGLVTVKESGIGYRMDCTLKDYLKTDVHMHVCRP